MLHFQTSKILPKISTTTNFYIKPASNEDYLYLLLFNNTKKQQFGYHRSMTFRIWICFLDLNRSFCLSCQIFSFFCLNNSQPLYVYIIYLNTVPHWPSLASPRFSRSASMANWLCTKCNLKLLLHSSILKLSKSCWINDVRKYRNQILLQLIKL